MKRIVVCMLIAALGAIVFAQEPVTPPASPEELQKQLSAAEKEFNERAKQLQAEIKDLEVKIADSKAKVDAAYKALEAKDTATNAELKALALALSERLRVVEERESKRSEQQRNLQLFLNRKWQVRINGSISAFSIIARGSERMLSGVSLREVDADLMKLANPLAVFPEIPDTLGRVQKQVDKALNFTIPSTWSSLPIIGPFLQPVATMIAGFQQKARSSPLMHELDKVMFASDLSVGFELFRTQRSERVAIVSRMCRALQETMNSTAEGLISLAGLKRNAKLETALFFYLANEEEVREGIAKALAVDSSASSDSTQIEQRIVDVEPVYQSISSNVRDFESLAQHYCSLSSRDAEELEVVGRKLIEYQRQKSAPHLALVGDRYLSLMGLKSDGTLIGGEIGPISKLKAIFSRDKAELMDRDANLSVRLLARKPN